MPDDAMTAPALQAVSRTLPAELSSVRRARDVVRDTLADWRADAIYDDVVLVASELVSNALQHALQPEPGPEHPATVELRLRRDGEHVICAVTDPSQEPPIRRPGDVLAGSGHGLQLVDSLSLCWGWNVHETIRAASPEPLRVGIPADLRADLRPAPGQQRAMHFVRKDIAPDLVARYRRALPVGSYLALSTAAADGMSEELITRLEDVYSAAAAPMVVRTRGEVEQLFEDVDLIDPGLTDVTRWRSQGTPLRIRILGGAGRVR